APAVPQEVHAPPRPLVRHHRQHAEPVRGPLRPEGLADLRGPVRELLSGVPADPPGALADYEEVGRDRRRVHERPQTALRLGDAAAGLLGVAWQARESTAAARPGRL